MELKSLVRYHEEKIFNSTQLRLIFGRRKLGKTFFVQNSVTSDYYFFIGKSNMIFNQNKEKLTYEQFFEQYKLLSQKFHIVIDEFHRLPQEFLDYLHFEKPKQLTLLTSTLWLATKMLEEKDSSIVGIFTPIKFNLINEVDIIKNIGNKEYNLNEVDIIEHSVYLREPILVDFYSKNIKHTVTQFLYNQKYFLKNLIGEIFSEEGRQFSKLYEGILLAVSNGKVISGEIASELFSKKIIEKDNPSLIQKNLEVLVHLGLIEKISIYNKKKFYYKITSPLLDLYFYLISKYDYVEQQIDLRFIEEVYELKLPFHVEDFLAQLLAKLKHLQFTKIQNPEIDIALTKFKKLELVGEVKWRKDEKNKEDKIAQKLNEFNAKEKIVISKSEIKSKIMQLELKDIIELAKNYKN